MNIVFSRCVANVAKLRPTKKYLANFATLWWNHFNTSKQPQISHQEYHFYKFPEYRQHCQ